MNQATDGVRPDNCDVATQRRAAKVLVVDDNDAVLATFRKVLSREDDGARARLDMLEQQLFGGSDGSPTRQVGYELELLQDGEAACRRAEALLADACQFAVAFIDMRMPGGWDGLTTIEALWRIDPDIQMVICSAYSDYGWDEIIERLGQSDRWLVLRKPFEALEVQQMTAALVEKWHMRCAQRKQVGRLEREVADQVIELQRLNRTLRLISRCNETLVRAKDCDSLLKDICERIVGDGGYALAWVGLADHDLSHRIEPAAFAGHNDGYLDGIDLRWDDSERGLGPGGLAIRSRQPVVARNLRQDPTVAFWRYQIEQHGFESSLALPLINKDDVIGMLAIYAYVADAFDQEEVLLLQEMADDLAFGIVRWREAAAREQAEQRLVFEVSHDSLTGLPKREVFLDRAGQAIRRAERENSGLAVMLVKAGRYRSVVSAFDHSAGDALVKEIGARLQRSLRAGDTVARIGNNDFAVLVSDLGEEQNAAPLAEKLLASLSPPLEVCGHQVYADAVIGICLCPRDGAAADILLRNAEAAVAGAQSEGANALQFYSAQMNQYASERLALEVDFHRAVNAGEMRVFLQPKANLRDGRICGAEALVRWQHPQHGLLAPSRFIGLAEETGLIVPLSEWIIREVCGQIAKWQAVEGTCVPVAVNISPRHLRHANLVPLIRDCLRTHDISADMLEVEITESVLLTDGEASIDVLKQLRSLGLHLALDDFGTGFSSLSYLRRLPVDCVKIDQSFVRDITTNPENAAICSAIVSLAHALRLRVIAEGVETEGQFSYLRNLGCDEMQGYYLHRPMPADEFPGFLRRGEWLSIPKDEGALIRTLLIVDDEQNVLSSLKRLVHNDSVRVLATNSALDGLELMAMNPVQVVLSDQRMPGMNGTEFLERVSKLYPDTIRIILSGYTDLETVVNAINRGVIYKFLTKPWDGPQLLAQIRSAFEYYELRRRQDTKP